MRRKNSAESVKYKKKKRRLNIFVIIAVAIIFYAAFDASFGKHNIAAFLNEAAAKLAPAERDGEKVAERVANSVKASIPLDENIRSSFALSANKNIFCCTKDGAKMYDKKGGVLWSDTYTMSAVKLSYRGNYFAVNESGGSAVNVYNETGKAYEIAADGAVLQANINQLGYLVLLVALDNGQYGIYIYSPLGEKLVYRVEQTDGVYPIDTALSPDGKFYAVSYIDTSDLCVKSKVVFYLISYNEADNSDGMYSGIEKENEYITFIDFLDNSTLAAVSDKDITAISGDGKEKWSVAHANEPKYVSVSSDGYIAIVYGGRMSNADARDENFLEIYNKGGVSTARGSIDNNIDYLCFFDGTAVIGGERNFTAIKTNGNALWNHEASAEVYQIIPVNNSDALYVTSGLAELIDIKYYNPAISKSIKASIRNEQATKTDGENAETDSSENTTENKNENTMESADENTAKDESADEPPQSAEQGE